MRRFVFEEGPSSKFWEIEVDGGDVTVRFGRIGTQGQAKTKSHASATAATKEAEKLVAEKTKKGYREEGADSPAASAAPAPEPVAPAPLPEAAEPARAIATPAAPVSGSTTIDGERVRFSAPAWVLPLAQRAVTDKAPRKKGLPFAKVWEGVIEAAERFVEKDTSLRWTAHEPRADALGAGVREHLARGGSPEGTFDRELEAATLAFANVVRPGTEEWLERPGKAFWHWVDRAGPEEALRTLLLSTRFGLHYADGVWPRPFALVMPDANGSISRHGKDTKVVREALRAFGVALLGDIVREGMADDPVTLAWLVEDAAAAARLYAETPPNVRVGLSEIAPLLDDAEAASALFLTMWGDDAMVRVVLKHGLALAPAVFRRAPNDMASSRRWIPVLACYPSLLSARLLVPLLERKPDRKLVGDALANMPTEALVALREAQGKRCKYKDAIDSLVATLGATAAREAAPAAGPSAVGAPSEDAPVEALPAVLRSPPWRAKKRPTLPVVEGLVAPRLEHSVSLANPAESARRWASAPSWGGHGVREELERGVRVRAERLLAVSLADLEALREAGLLGKVDAQFWTPDAYMPGLDVLLHAHGVAVVPSLLALAPVVPPKLAAGLAAVGATEVAELACGWLANKATRKAAEAWARQFPRHAAAGLLPLALGRPSPTRDRALSLLMLVDRAGHREAVLEAARAHGEEVVAATQVVLSRDPLEQCPSKAPKLPEGLDAMPRLLLRDGREVSADACTAFLEMLAFTPLDPAYAGIEEVKLACDVRRTDELSCALVRAWVAGGMATAHEWMVRQVALVGTDVAARFLYDRGRAWAQDNQKQRAILALDVLGAMGTDLALSLVGRVSRSGQRQYVKDRAAEVLAEVAAARGLSPDELEDRTAPDLGLDEAGSLRLDFGPRAFRVGFDEHLVPFVKDEAGARLPSLPRAVRSDDAVKAKAASEAWKLLKAEAEKVASDQIARLLRMMSDERRVETEVFESAFVRHPLVGHLARRLVWGTYSSEGALLQTFRIAEDRSYASVDDTPLALPKDARIGVVHPYAVADRSLLARWGNQLSDYEILAPFPQLSREVVVLDAAAVPARYAGKKSPSALLYGLRRHGWRAAADEYGITAFSKTLGGAEVTVGLTPELRAGAQEQHTMSVSLSVSAGVAGPTPLQLSELVHQLDAVLA